MREDLRALLGEVDVYSLKFRGQRRRVFGPLLRNVRQKTTWSCLLGGRASRYSCTQSQLYSLQQGRVSCFCGPNMGPLGGSWLKGSFERIFSRDETPFSQRSCGILTDAKVEKQLKHSSRGEVIA